VDLAAFRTVLRDGFFEGEVDTGALVDATFASPSSVTASDIQVVVAELDGRIVSVAGAWLVDGGAGIGWVATLPGARRRGLGALVTARAVAFAIDHGAELVVLEASPEGLPVYERLGFQTVGWHTIWEAADPA
jgi:GNAT superfamily N-acetyltransferase